MGTNKHIFLSYLLSEELSGYGNGKRIEIIQTRNIANGDASNNSQIVLPTHFGTHIDFSYHFDNIGKTISTYQASDFIFDKIGFVDISSLKPTNYLISVVDLENFINQPPYNKNAELLIIKTGFSYNRGKSEYWESNWGFDLGTASLIRKYFPSIKAVAFDLISLNSYKQREIGRKAHKEFLIKEGILIIEDVDLRSISRNTNFKKVMVIPLRFDNAEGAPVTIIGEIYD